MKKLTKILAAVLVFQFCAGLYAQEELKDFVPGNILSQLVSEGSYTSINEEGDFEYHILPDCEYSDAIRLNRVSHGNMNLVAEKIYTVKKADLKRTRTFPKGEPDIMDAAEIFTSVSNMKDVVYYSNTRRKKMLLYKIVSYIESPENPVVLEDIKLRETDGVEKYFQMHDASFGLNYFSLKYRQNENTLFVSITNLDPMGFAGIKGVKEKDLIINYLIVDCGDSYVMYLGADIKMIKTPGMRKTILKSFNSRLAAMYDWFVKQF